MADFKIRTRRDVIDAKISSGQLPDRFDIQSLGADNAILCRVLGLCWRDRCDCTWEETMMLAVYHLIKQNERLWKDCLELQRVRPIMFTVPMGNIPHI